ncbi:GNAT family N-acetyltransferase [Loigolactobacillus backii]|uniref:GNAT family N-acetyltransferase n=1 Tax=Loigolactobacillus backii TaxID=375175 RepID=UPI0007F10351|nr:GNAT family N-acetyltransferase [Loigolactobacillus backii]ANK60747.1 acetyltransferase [Loigolactobacillus backii]
MQINFRIAQQKDLPFIVQTYNQTIPGRQATADVEPVTVEERQTWFDSYNERRPIWLIESNSQPAGWIALEDFYGRPAYRHTVELSLYIADGFRGQHLGQKSLEFVEGQCPALKINTIVTFIFGHNKPSLSLFKKNGFVTWGHLPRVAEMDKIERDLDILDKRIY